MLEDDLNYIHSNHINVMTLSQLSQLDNFDTKRVCWNRRHNLLTNLFPSLNWWSRTYSIWYILGLECLNFLLYLLPNLCLLLFGCYVMKLKNIRYYLIGILMLLIFAIILIKAHPLRYFIMLLTLSASFAVVGYIMQRSRIKN